jgi:hypothetical protein
MRKLLFRICFLCSLALSSLFSQTGPYTIKLRLGPVDTTCYPRCDDPTEWLVNVYVDIFDADNNYVTPSNAYYYQWYDDDCYGEPGFGEVVAGYGHSEEDFDGLLEKGFESCCSSCPFQTLLLFVSVTIDGEEYASGVIRLPDAGSGTMAQRAITVEQKRENQQTAGNIGQQIGSAIYNYPAPQTFYKATTISSEVYRGSQGFVPSTNDRYNRWSGPTGDLPDIVNHRSLALSSGQQQYTSQLKTAQNVTIQTCVVEGGAVARAVYFKDPWLVDDNSDQLGPRNRGTNALFVSKSTPFYPLNDSDTKGVFLNQDTSGNNPHYRLRAYETIEAVGLVWSFGYWTGGTGASFSNANSIETAVVFNSADAVVTAYYPTVVKPLPPTNLDQVASVGQHVHLTWTDNPNEDVSTYHIYRHEVGQERTLRATVNRGVESWTDPYVLVAAPKEGPEYLYDVCSIYDDVESDYATVSTFGEEIKIGAIGNGMFYDLENESGVPTAFSVSAYPNPFNPSTTLSYRLPQDAVVSVQIYDLIGRKVRSLVDESKSAGYYRIVWNGRDEAGSQVASGVYLYRFSAIPTDGGKIAVRSGKLVLTR